MRSNGDCGLWWRQTVDPAQILSSSETNTLMGTVAAENPGLPRRRTSRDKSSPYDPRALKLTRMGCLRTKARAPSLPIPKNRYTFALQFFSNPVLIELIQLTQ